MTAKGASGRPSKMIRHLRLYPNWKQREESASLYRDNDRLDLAEAEEAEANIFRVFHQPKFL